MQAACSPIVANWLSQLTKLCTSLALDDCGAARARQDEPIAMASSTSRTAY